MLARRADALKEGELQQRRSDFIWAGRSEKSSPYFATDAS